MRAAKMRGIKEAPKIELEGNQRIHSEFRTWYSIEDAKGRFVQKEDTKFRKHCANNCRF